MWGAMELYEAGQEQERQYIKDMRPTPIEAGFTFEYFSGLIDSLLSGEKRSVKGLLTQEQLIPGLGNAIAGSAIATGDIAKHLDIGINGVPGTAIETNVGPAHRERCLNALALLDVREPDEVSRGRIEGAVNVPLHSLRDRLAELPQGRPIIVYCAAGLRAYLACRILSQSGFAEVFNLSGGYQTYAVATAEQSSP